MPEWSLIVKASGAVGSAPPTSGQLDQIVAAIGGADTTALYPGASGRGHGMELRFWIEAPDAVRAASRAAEVVEAALASARLADWPVVRVHVASVQARVLELYPEVESARHEGQWSVMVRAVAPDDAEAPSERVRLLLPHLPGPDRLLTARAGAYDARFWVRSEDGATAAVAARDLMRTAHTAVGLGGWRFVHVHAASRDERLREHYPGVERRAGPR